MRFLDEFERRLIFQGFEGILGWYEVIFGLVEIGKMLDFVGFARSGYRSGILSWIWVKCLGNADFTRSLWIEQICRSWQPASCFIM